MTFSAGTNAPVGYQGIHLTDTVQNHPLGTRLKAKDPIYGEGEFIYLKGVAATVIGSWVSYNPDDFSTTLLANADIGSVATSMSANVAGSFGWYQIFGKAIGRALVAFLDNALVFTTATVGYIDDAVVVGGRVKNAEGASAVGVPSANLAEFELSYPFVDNGTAA